ncbi:MAG: hypothetical protein AAF513_06845 [Pseudomonadota bacterium]
MQGSNRRSCVLNRWRWPDAVGSIVGVASDSRHSSAVDLQNIARRVAWLDIAWMFVGVAGLRMNQRSPERRSAEADSGLRGLAREVDDV